jgi:hypothetical protein
VTRGTDGASCQENGDGDGGGASRGWGSGPRAVGTGCV